MMFDFPDSVTEQSSEIIPELGAEKMTLIEEVQELREAIDQLEKQRIIDTDTIAKLQRELQQRVDIPMAEPLLPFHGVLSMGVTHPPHGLVRKKLRIDSTKHKKTMCNSVLFGEMCTFGTHCAFAHSNHTK